jgi:hypothetical protein
MELKEILDNLNKGHKLLAQTDIDKETYRYLSGMLIEIKNELRHYGTLQK